ncbi:DUF7527 domain-containing protein [Halorussus halobius]|uniref:DUF7527 domain-containing protein n=1 Tax=Halorussus halobius TaxID=1710537 RepID=UPI0010925DEC|nr:hypothetical protein [Halorussus halobius]
MEPRTVEQVESWSTRSVADGYAGLRELSDGEFSGAVRGSGAWLFMLNGRIVGVFEGTLDDFEDADATAYAAPHPSLPLLFSMQEQGGDTRAKYYTNDTPLSEVDDTLTEGKFTGFVELSENVLSGDYYVAYYGGRSLSVAFVGASEQVVTGEEAFERAADEVGIYEVTDVDVKVVDVPEPADDEPDAAPGGSGSGGGAPGSTGASGAGGGGSSGDAATANDAASRDAAGRRSAGSSSEAASNPSASRSGSNDADSTTDSDAATGASARSSGDDADASDRRRNAPARESSDAGTTEPSDASATDSAESASSPSKAGGADPSPGTEASASERSRPAESGRTTDSARNTAADRTASTREPAGASGGASADRSTSGDAATGPDVRDAGPTEDAGSAGDAGSSGDAGARSEAKAGGRSVGTAGTADAADSTGSGSSAVGGEAEWRETTTIPSLDPDLSDEPDEPSDDSQADATPAGGDRSRADASGEQSRGRRPTKERTSRAGTSETTGTAAGESGAAERTTDDGSGESSEARARIRKLRKQLEQRKQQVEQLKERLSSLESKRNEYKRERDALSQEVERLEAKLDGASSAGTSAVGRQLDEADAFDGTNLFVRYDSKGEATLDEAAKGQVDRSDVNANLRLEHHTQFEADEVSVDGEPFEAFLVGSFEYEFASWVVEELLYEIRDTGKRNALKELYEAIPKIDRVDLHGTVSAGDTREDTRQESFDVIMRDRMGEPLVVADLNDSRDPTTGEMMGSLVDAASDVSRSHDELAGAFQVTASFFEPEALETAEAATSGGLLSREKRASFVKLSRKRGYHLCLVESRGGDFHLNVPEL